MQKKRPCLNLVRVICLGALLFPVACGEPEDLTQVTKTEGFMNGEPVGKFKSAIFDFREPSPGRKITFLFVGHDEDLCGKLVGDAVAVDESSKVVGPVIASVWTGKPSDWSFESGEGRRVEAVRSGFPNGIATDGIFAVDASGKIGGEIPTKHFATVKEANDDALIGNFYFRSKDNDRGSMSFKARRCRGLADTGTRWFTVK